MSKKPVICQLLHGMGVGGAEVLVARIVRKLREKYQFIFLCLDHLGELGEQLQGEGFPVEVVTRRSGIDWRYPFRLSSQFRRHKVALIHAHQYTPFFYALAARLLYWKPSILFTEHGRHVPDYPRKKRIFYNRLMLQRRDRIVAVGAAVQKALIVNEGLPENRIQIIYNGVDLTPYQEETTDRQAVRAELGIDSSDIAIFQVARMVSVKDHLTALRAMELVGHRRSDVKLILVGDGPEREAIEQFIQEHRLTETVKLSGLRSDVPQLLQSGDIFLLSSTTEGIPLTIIEAMAARLPVVSTAAGGVGEVVQDGTTGLLAPIKDHVKLADHLLALSGNPDLRDQMGEKGHAIAMERFGEPEMIQAYDRLFEEMLHAR